MYNVKNVLKALAVKAFFATQEVEFPLILLYFLKLTTLRERIFFFYLRKACCHLEASFSKKYT